MHRAATTLAAVLASAGIAAAQTPVAPIGADPIGGRPIGAEPVGSSPIGPDPIGTAQPTDGSAAATSPIEGPRPTVRGYVSRQSGPSATLTRPVVVGEPLPDAVGIRAIPNSDYGFALVGGRRVIVEPETRRVVEILD